MLSSTSSLLLLAQRRPASHRPPTARSTWEARNVQDDKARLRRDEAHAPVANAIHVMRQEVP